MSKLILAHHNVHTLLLTAGLALANPIPAFANEPHVYQIQSGDNADAIKIFAEQSGIQIVASEDALDGKTLKSVSGTLSLEQALNAMLQGTGLTHKYVGDKAVAVMREERKVRVAQADVSNSAVGNAPDHVLAEVIVTAQKREESLQEVPVPVTVLSGEVLTQSNQVRLQDYYSKVPGLNLTISPGANTPSLSIRGITSGGGDGSATVGIVVDDVPYGSSVGYGVTFAPDIDPGDLAHVEVLRGPQGTLYGASSIGGLLKFVTLDPSTQALSGRLQVGASSLFNGIGPGYNFRGSINVPVSDTTAVRASAFRQRDGGFIDNIQTGQKGINRRTSQGGRAAFLWKPSDDLSLKLSASLQDAKRDGNDAAGVGPGFGDLQEKSLPNSDTLDQKIQVYGATLKANLGSAELTSLSGYNVSHSNFRSDLTGDSFGFWDGLANQFLGTTGPGAMALTSYQTRKFTQELRLAVPVTDRFNWMIGGFYDNEKDEFLTTDRGADPSTGTPTADYFLGATTGILYKEYAVFTDLNYKFTDRFDVQLGGRWSENKQSFSSDNYGIVAPLFYTQPVIKDVRSKGNATTYLLTPRFKISPDLMVYARLASGYRPGGANAACGAGIPCAYDAEKTKNYDIGLKAEFLDHRLSVDTALYYIDYNNITAGIAQGAFSGLANFGKAKSQGLEVSIEARPASGLSLAAWVAWNDAEFKGGFDSAARRPGDRLPYASRVSGNFSVDQQFSVTEALGAFVGGNVSYVGEREGNPTKPRQRFPGYAQADVHAGLTYDSWTFTAFLNNVTDKRGILSGGLDYQYTFPYPAFSYILPRTFGVNAVNKF